MPYVGKVVTDLGRRNAAHLAKKQRRYDNGAALSLFKPGWVT